MFIIKFLIDTHCHTIASGHAYSTLQEVAREAQNKGLEIIAITDHGPTMPGGPHIFHIANQRVIPNVIYGVEILKGVEANIIDDQGNVDVPEWVLKGLDIVLAGFHEDSLEPGDKDFNTSALMNVMENKYVDIVAHPGNPRFPIDNEKLVLKAKETGTLIEINNSSFHTSRRGSRENCIEIVKLCKKHKVMVAVGSDSHISFDVGRFDRVMEVFNDAAMPSELIINYSTEKLKNYLKSKGKLRFKESSVIPEV